MGGLNGGKGVDANGAELPDPKLNVGLLCGVAPIVGKFAVWPKLNDVGTFKVVEDSAAFSPNLNKLSLFFWSFTLFAMVGVAAKKINYLR